MTLVRYEQQGSIGHIVLADPPQNLVNSQFSTDLDSVIRQASQTEIRALLVRAEGPNFSEGGDVAEILEKDTHQYRSFIQQMHQSYRALEALQVPSVAAVRGSAYGGGLELALACDFIVAAENAEFLQLEVGIGSMPQAGAVQRFAERAGRAIATRYIMLSEPMNGALAGELGVANFVVSENDVEARAAALAKRLSEGPTRSYMAVRAMLKIWSGGGVPAADAAQLDIAVPLHDTEDARLGRTSRAEAMKNQTKPKPVMFVGR